MDMASETHTVRVYNILVIEDLLSWQKKFKRFLRDEPFNVNIAANNQEAQRFFKAYALDLLILDVNLSGVPYNVDGLYLANQLWHQNKNLRIIIVSGDKWWNKRLPAYGFKPSFILEKQSLDQDDFVEKIYQALSLQ